jgi:hypothetical protein
MSASHLPDDLSDWPKDPYAILGVPFGIDPRDLRRAYTQLIRSYKPEHYPEHFRRIREAYETVLRQVTGFGRSATWSPARSASSPAEEVSPPPRRQPDLMEQLQLQWERASRGLESDAYRSLRDLYEQYPTSAELCLRLYWLLRIVPEVDARRTPCDWLVTGLRANEMTGPLRELYRREIAENSANAHDDAATSLLMDLAGSPQVVDLADWRWLAAARLQCWDWIMADVKALRRPVSQADSERWFHLLLLALNHLAWAPTPEARRRTARYFEEAYEHEELHLRLRGEFDRLEQLQHLSSNWHALNQQRELPAVVAYLISVAWGRPDGDVRPRLEAFVAEVADNPPAWLATLTRIHRRGTGLIDLVWRTLQAQQTSLGRGPISQRATAEALDAIADFLDLQDEMTYDVFRKTLLAFCLTEAIHPEAVAASLQGRMDYWLNEQEHLAQVIKDDAPLHCVWLAHRMFWA